MYIVSDEHESTFHTYHLKLIHFYMIMMIKQIAKHNNACMCVFAQHLVFNYQE